MKEKCSSVLILVILVALIGSNLLVLVTHPALADSEDIYAYPLDVVAGPGAASPAGLSPAQVRTVYNLPSTGGHGTIAIVDAYDDPTVLNDTNVFSSQYGLPSLNSTNFEKHMMASTINYDDNWSVEISLDVQWAHAIAPNAKILLVEATSNAMVFANGTAGPLLDAVDYARNQPDVVAVSMSWTTRNQAGFSSESNYDYFFTSSFGASFFSGSGDDAENASWPAASPNVIGVGGTTLNFNQDGSLANETVWNGNGHATGGGVSAFELEPTYQQSYGVQGANGHRCVPDVSFDADPHPGYPVYTSFLSQPLWFTVGGTSAGTPQWAAIKSLGLLVSNDRLYAAATGNYSSCFRDITVGSNGNYNATSHYDFCTGLGSPLTTTFHLPPGSPVLSGPQTVVRNVWYTYTTNGVVDPDASPIRYHLNVTGPTNYPYQNTTIWVSSGTPMSWNLMWQPVDNLGTYLLQAWVEDSYGLLSPMASLSVSLVNATITAVNLYYSDPSQNLTTLDAPVTDYFVNVNFTWSGGRGYDVSLYVDVLNPGSANYAWLPLNGAVQYSYIDPGNYYVSSIDITSVVPQQGTGTLQATLASNSQNCAVPWNQTVNIVSTNHAPTTPTFVSYPSAGYTDEWYVCTVNTTDPETDNIQYVFNWGDGTANTTLSWRPSGMTATAGHTWNSPGTYTVTAYAYDPYGAWSSKDVTTVIFEQPIGGCPYVYCWNGSRFIRDNNILPASETGNGTDTKDYYLLQQPPVPVFSNGKSSVYALQIREFENEQDYIDQVKLISVDHAQGTNIAVTPEGEIVTYQNPASPLSCVDEYGNTCLNEIGSMNGNISDPTTYFQGNNGDWLLLDFGRVTATQANLIFRDDQKCWDVCIDVQILNGSSWQTVEVLHPRDFWGMEAANMTAYIPANADFIVRLLWTAPHRLDYVGLDTSPQAQTQINSAPPTLAVHSTLGNVTAKLLYDDENCVKLVSGQQITLAFTLPNKAQGMTRDFILFTNGYYYIITP